MAVQTCKIEITAFKSRTHKIICLTGVDRYSELRVDFSRTDRLKRMRIKTAGEPEQYLLSDTVCSGRPVKYSKFVQIVNDKISSVWIGLFEMLTSSKCHISLSAKV